MIALAFALILLLAIWLAIRLGGVRKRDRHADTGRDGSSPAASSTETDNGGANGQGGGGSFGGGGASGSWGNGSGGDGGGD